MSSWITFEALAVSTALQLVTLLVLMTIIAFSREVPPGFRHWLASLGLLMSAPLVLLAFPADAPLRGGRLFASWAPFLASSVLLHEGLRRFRRRPSHWRIDAAIVLGGLLSALISRVLDAQYPTLLVLLSLAMATVLTRAAATCFRGVRPRLRPAYYLFGAGVVWQALVTILRAGIVFFGARVDFDQARELAEVVFFFGGSVGTMVTVIGAITAVGQRQEVEMRDIQEVLRRQATTDSLTGLANRRSFFERAHRSLDDGSDHSLILFDIDHFKQVNDSFGHDLGDLVLRRVAEALLATLPGNAIIGRLGGEEFVALMRGDQERAHALAEKALDEVVTHVHRRILRHPVTVSAGVARVAAEGLDEALRRADRRLYRAKKGGRGRVVAEGQDTVSGQGHDRSGAIRRFSRPAS